MIPIAGGFFLLSKLVAPENKLVELCLALFFLNDGSNLKDKMVILIMAITILII